MTASRALDELIGTAGPRRGHASDAIVLEALDEDRRITDVHRRGPCACAHDDA